MASARGRRGPGLPRLRLPAHPCFPEHPTAVCEDGPPSTSQTIGTLYQGIGLFCMVQSFLVQRGTTKVDFSFTEISPPDASGKRVM